jgi:Tfp pilus assembly protein PilX
MHTFPAKTPFPAESSIRRPALRGQEGFLLMEVLISTLLIALIVIATFTGFDVANRTTGDERAHAQADVLAQQDEDRLRGKPISELSSLNETHTAKANGTEFTITSKAKFISDATGSESCSAASVSADYIETISEVSWPALKNRPKVVETSLVSPHVGGSLLVQVLTNSAKPVTGMEVTATGPAPSTAVEKGTTDSNGCVIFGSVEPGEYQVNAKKTGYVEANGLPEVPTSQRTAFVTNGSTTKKLFEFDEAGELSVSFETSGVSSPKGDTFLAFNTGITTPSYRSFGTVGKLETPVNSSKTLFPFTAPYTVYAGSCLADNPETNDSAVKAPTATVLAGADVPVTVPMPPLTVLTDRGTKSSPGTGVEATGNITDTGCAAEGITAKRTIKTESSGKLLVGLPYGTYSMCLVANISGKNYAITTAGIKNNSPSGVTVPTLYMNEGTVGGSCP